MSNETAIATIENNAFAIFSDPDMDLQELLQDNLGDEDFTPMDLERLTVPAGGGTSFEIPTMDGLEDVKEVEALVVHVSPARAYWQQGMDETGEGTPPDCSSENGTTGNGEPGGECLSCPFNQYGSAEKGKGKACKEMRNLFILTEGAVLPFNLVIPPTSIKPFKKYMTSLTQFRRSIYSVTTKITLEKTKNAGGITYSKIAFKAGSNLTKEQSDLVRAYKKAFKQAFEKPQTATPEA